MNRQSMLRVGVSLGLCVLVIGMLVGFVASPQHESSATALASNMAHPGVPATLEGYRLPFDRGQKSVITYGPGEGDHTGASGEAIDFSPRGWSNVYSAKAGTVYIRGNYSTTWGNLMVLKHADGFYTYYAHLKSPGLVGVNTPVAQGQQIGVVGMTGNATGIHLHFEVRDGMSGNNPGTGDSREHPARRIRGIGWYPWYPIPDANSGYTIRTVSSHAPNQCVNSPTIIMDWIPHGDFAHTHTDQYSKLITLTRADATPAFTVNATHGTHQGSKSFVVPPTPKKYFIHLRAYDATTGEWASDDEVAHQGPYKIGAGCVSSMPPGYEDQIPDDDQ